MTTESQPTVAPKAVGPSIHVKRARTLLYAGLAGGVAATVVCLGYFGFAYGARGLTSVLVGAGMVLFFYTAGQVVMVMFADAGARTLLGVSMSSYTARIVALGFVLLSYSNSRENWPSLVPMAVFISTIAVVAGWLVVEVFAFSRLRIGVYDTEYVSPPEASGAQ